MSKLIISVSGLRGVIGKTLTPQVAGKFAAAYASFLPPGPIILGRDGRSSGPMLRSAIIASLTACGRDCIDADVVATPTIGVLVKEKGSAGGIQISASHNPPEYNGIKLFGSDGRVLDAISGAAIRDAYFAETAPYVSYENIGNVYSESDPHGPHLKKVLATVNQTAIQAAKHKVLLDSNHGAGGLLGRKLLEALGCEVVLLGETPDGQFAHVPEPTADNLAGIADKVREHDCAVGFCQDPDADRLALVDAEGHYIGEEYTLALCVKRAMMDESLQGTIVINGATSGMSERLAAAVGQTALRSSVGEANVADMMIENKATYGGEGNGGPIDPRVGYVRDSFVGMAQVLDLMTTTGNSLASLAEEIPKLHIYKAKASVSAEQLPELFVKLIAQNPTAEANQGDGLRLSWPDRWLLVRGSNTEPIVRFIAEAESIELAQEMCDQAASNLVIE